MDDRVVYKGYTDHNGQIIVEDLPYGEYYIAEVEASTGYRVLDDNIYFTLDKKLERFLTMSLRAFCVPESEIKNVIAFIQKLDMCHLADQVMQHLFQALAMHFDFSLSE